MRKRSLFFLSVAFAFFISFRSISAESRDFEWKLEKDDVLELNEFHNVLFRFRNELKTQEEVRRQDKNRIILLAEECGVKGCRIRGNFDTYVRYGDGIQPFRKEKSFYSEFFIQRNGIYVVPEKYSVPNLRSVPGFPDSPLKPGDSWSMPAEESFDFGSGRFRVPVEAEYTLLGPGEWRWNEFSGKGEKILYNYTIFYEQKTSFLPIPNKVYGMCRGVVYFDSEKGIPQYKENKLTYTFVYPDGRVTEANFHIHGIYQFRKALSQVAKENLKESIRKDLNIPEFLPGLQPEPDSQMTGFPEAFQERERKEKPKSPFPLDVRTSEEGITISMDSVLFDTDRFDLKPEAIEQLAKIASVLKKYPDREIRVSGHTDNRGGKDYNQRLSELRAKSVLDALVKRFGIEEHRISYEGLGDSRPVDTNSTEQGRAKNRRVDITLVVE